MAMHSQNTEAYIIHPWVKPTKCKKVSIYEETSTQIAYCLFLARLCAVFYQLDKLFWFLKLQIQHTNTREL
jgi:hypothetical protein